MSERIYPDVAIPPGEHLADTLRELEMSQSELARRMGRPVQAINQIVNGSKVITAETALQLEDVTRVPAHVWLHLEADYQLVKARQGSDAPAAIETVKYRRSLRGGVTWHFCTNCSHWPTTNYEAQKTKPRSGEFCNECLRKRDAVACTA